MKRHLISTFIAATAALALSGCKTVTTASDVVAAANQPLCNLSQTVQVTDARLAAGAELTYNAIGNAWLIARANPDVPVSVRQKVFPLVQKSYDYLKAVRVADQACDAASLQDKYKVLMALKDQVTALIPSQMTQVQNSGLPSVDPGTSK